MTSKDDPKNNNPGGRNGNDDLTSSNSDENKIDEESSSKTIHDTNDYEKNNNNKNKTLLIDPCPDEDDPLIRSPRAIASETSSQITTATLNDVVADSERKSVFNSVNFAGQVVPTSNSTDSNFDPSSSGSSSTSNSPIYETGPQPPTKMTPLATESLVESKTNESITRTRTTTTSAAPPQLSIPEPPSLRPTCVTPPNRSSSISSIPPPSPAAFRRDSHRKLPPVGPPPHHNLNRSINRPEEEKPLLDEIREVMAQSFLAFLLADLRLMSGTGRIGTKYEFLAIDSDVCKRHTADQIAGITEEIDIGQCRGLSPAVIMAIVILEIRDTFVKTAEEKRKKSRLKSGDAKVSLATTVDIDTDERFVAYENDEAKKKMTEESMESLMRCYSRMVSEDLVTDIPNVKRRRATMNMMNHGTEENNNDESQHGYYNPMSQIGFPRFSRHNANNVPKTPPPQTTNRMTSASEIKPKSNRSMLGSVREETDSEIGFEVRQVGSKDSISSNEEKLIAPMSTGKLGLKAAYSERSAGTSPFLDDGSGWASKTSSFFFSPTRKYRQTPNPSGELPPPAGDGATATQYHPSFREQLQLTKEKSRMIREKLLTDYEQTVDYMLPRNHEANTQREFQELTDVFFDQGETNEEFKATLGVTYTRKEMVEVMRNAVATRNDARLQFLSKFFKEGSVSSLLVQSHARVVWVNDWYPLKDLTYAISVDALQRRVMVVFRGAITAEDWKSAFNFKFHKIRNPVKDDFEGKSDVLRVFSGLYQYLFRKRKDTGTTKYDEIANLVHKYGMERIGPGYRLFVTGHSLGGALTHFFAFFASTEERFTTNGPVKAIAFACPYIGGHSWADAIRHQERKKRLQIVQVRNNCDVIPRLPANFKMGKRGPLWRHVGIGVTLPKLPRRWNCGKKWKPLVHYWGKEKSFLDSTIHGFRRNVFFHTSFLRPWTLNRSHTLFELQDRLMYGEQNKKPGGDFELLQNTIDELYAKLDENDFETFKKNKRWNLKYPILQKEPPMEPEVSDS